jgi:hypothetical protein
MGRPDEEVRAYHQTIEQGRAVLIVDHSRAAADIERVLAGCGATSVRSRLTRDTVERPV